MTRPVDWDRVIRAQDACKPLRHARSLLDSGNEVVEVCWQGGDWRHGIDRTHLIRYFGDRAARALRETVETLLPPQ